MFPTPIGLRMHVDREYAFGVENMLASKATNPSTMMWACRKTFHLRLQKRMTRRPVLSPLLPWKWKQTRRQSQEFLPGSPLPSKNPLWRVMRLPEVLPVTQWLLSRLLIQKQSQHRLKLQERIFKVWLFDQVQCNQGHMNRLYS